MTLRSLAVLVVLTLTWPTVAAAQLRPEAFASVITTSTATSSIAVGCSDLTAPTAVTCTGGIMAGPLAVGAIAAGAITSTLNANAQGVLKIVNNSAGAAAEAKFQADNGTDLMEVGMTGTGLTPSGIFAANIGFVHTNSAVGLAIGTNSGPMIFSAQDDINTETMRIQSGKLGIGLGNGVTPIYKLDIQPTTTVGNITAIRLLRATGAAVDTNAILWQSSALLTASISDEVTSGATGSFLISTNNGAGLVERVRVKTDGTLKISAYGAGVAVFDGTGLITSQAGATHAACSVSVTAITVTNGVVTAITCS